MKSFILTLALASSLLAAPQALAGGGHDHGPKYGGVVREARHIAYELVAKPDSLTLYVSNHDQPVATQGASAEAVIYARNAKTTVKLEPAGDNRLEAKGSFKVGVGTRVAVTVTLAGKAPARATFNLK